MEKIFLALGAVYFVYLEHYLYEKISKHLE